MSLKDRIAGKGKSLIILAGVFLGVLLITAGHVKGEPVETGTVSLKIQDVRYKKESMEIIYIVKNSTVKPVWICEKMSASGVPPYESIVSIKQKRVEIMNNVVSVPPDVYTDSQFSVYRKVEPGTSERLTQEIRLPIPDYVLFGISKSESIGWAEIGEIKLTTGYFMEQLDKVDDCCKKTSRPDEIWVSWFWPGNSGGRVVSDEIKLRAGY